MYYALAIVSRSTSSCRIVDGKGEPSGDRLAIKGLHKNLREMWVEKLE